MSNMVAKLRVVLKADEVIVAEVEDAVLWQRVLSAINSGNGLLTTPVPSAGPEVAAAVSGVTATAASHAIGMSQAAGNGQSALQKFANQIGVSREAVEGACDPRETVPYIHLDPHHWESMRSSLPARGGGAISPMTAAATLLALWFRAAGLGNPTQAQAQAVLGTIGIRDSNPGRGIQSATWLQPRTGGQIVLNPAQVSRAVMLAKAFCSQDWTAWKRSGD